MKLLHVIHSTNPVGGGPIEGIRQLRPEMERLGVRVEIASCDPRNAPWLAAGDLRIHALGPGVMSYGYTPQLLPWLRAYASRYDAVIVNGIWQYHSFAAWRALRHADTPYFVFTHGMLDPWFKRRYPLKHIKKWMYWPWAEYRVLRDARAVIFTCEEERLLARRSFWLYRANEAVISYGTADPPGDGNQLAQQFRRTHPELEGRRLILFFWAAFTKRRDATSSLRRLPRSQGTTLACIW